ncbi:RagB/SusD family nutrient uptake outer membrane protein [Mucilaginibacter celer]|uniref:RagB/SusD family nutrient uptake outer membrane protein n=1 Tax=Mucilaginibacter celer TaxID=2305508 RepID=A0A494VLM8_9SPHI|nr:RagB/SusD family nutrient uptake outer membrane protein [Mucilaginibacter celer]AYL94491.1 RagB/SusD family nutrient uptake outer membrane protein [Mucilaginibacter celer]
MRKYISIILLLIAVAQTSCKKVLDVTSPNEVADATVFKNVAGLRSARIGMYSTLQSKNYYGGYYPLLAECYSDNGTTGGYDVIDLTDIANKAVSPSNIYTSAIYIQIYNSIYAANKIIENADKVPGTDATELSNIKGEAYFIRSLASFDLLRMFGEHWDNASAFGISIVTSTANPATPVKRSSVADSYKQIIADAQQAVKLLNTDNGSKYASQAAANALLARVYLYQGNKAGAATTATLVINNSNYALLATAEFTKIYTQKNTGESVFELVFDQQNNSAYNGLTYVRDDALRTDVTFLAAEDLNTFFTGRPTDARSALVDYENVDQSIQPDGRTEKYRGETTRDNSAYIIRLAEVYLIRAEALGRTAGLADLNYVRQHRGMAKLTAANVPTDEAYLNAVLNERRAELNFEGHRLFDLARTQKVADVLGDEVNPIMPIPQAEISATGGVVVQNKGY